MTMKNKTVHTVAAAAAAAATATFDKQDDSDVMTTTTTMIVVVVEVVLMKEDEKKRTMVAHAFLSYLPLGPCRPGRPRDSCGWSDRRSRSSRTAVARPRRTRPVARNCTSAGLACRCRRRSPSAATSSRDGRRAASHDDVDRGGGESSTTDGPTPPRGRPSGAATRTSSAATLARLAGLAVVAAPTPMPGVTRRPETRRRRRPRDPAAPRAR